MVTQKKIRNILIVGRVGSGKSTLANVLLSGSNKTTEYFKESYSSTGETKDLQKEAFMLNETTEYFKESYSSTGGTKEFQKLTFTWKDEEKNEIEYHVVDTPGIGSISMAKYKISEIINEISSRMPEGISQVLFVVDGRFTAEEIQVFELFKKDIFNSSIVKFTTIVRTKFNNFKNKDDCNKDKKYLCGENEIITKIVNSCNGIIYVDNPPTNISLSDEDDRKRIDIHRKRREKSRDTLLVHLEKECWHENYYKLGGLFNLTDVKKGQLCPFCTIL